VVGLIISTFCSYRARPCRRGSFRADRAFTILEVQVAIVVLAITILTLGGHHRIMNSLLRGVQQDRQAGGFVDLVTERGAMTYTEEGDAPSPPPCNVTVYDSDLTGFPRIYVRVQQAPW
jgi:hypothetical protein